MGDGQIADATLLNSIIGEGTRLRGEFGIDGLLRIDGDFCGTIRTTGKILVAGLLPVVGVPLPLVSYGGTSLVTILAGFGWIALAIVIFGGWRPMRVALGCYLFGALQVVALKLQPVFPGLSQILPSFPFPLMIFTLVVVNSKTLKLLAALGWVAAPPQSAGPGELLLARQTPYYNVTVRERASGRRPPRRCRPVALQASPRSLRQPACKPYPSTPSNPLSGDRFLPQPLRRSSRGFSSRYNRW